MGSDHKDDMWHKNDEINESYHAEIEAIKAESWNRKASSFIHAPTIDVLVILNKPKNDQ